MKPRQRSVPGIGGFTLIELMVVVSIIAILMSILLPSLKRARDQAKRVVCQSNMKNINNSLMMYLNEFDTYPLILRISPDSGMPSWATWNYGGWTGRDFDTYCSDEGEGTFCYHTNERPLSIYMREPDTIRPDNPGPDEQYGTADDDVVEMPIFQCPADEFSHQWMYKAGYDPTVDVWEMSSYNQVGTSYHINFYWFYQAQVRVQVPPGPAYWERKWRAALDLGVRIWNRPDRYGGASRFVALVEDPFDWGIVQGLRQAANPYAGPDFTHDSSGEQTMGFHKQWSRHMLAFLDGHVDYLQADTRYQRETDWTVTNEEWFDTRRRENCPPSDP